MINKNCFIKNEIWNMDADSFSKSFFSKKCQGFFLMTCRDWLC